MNRVPGRIGHSNSTALSWIQERLYPYFSQAHKVSRPLVREKTKFQKLEIVHSPFFGNILLLDGIVQTTKKDEFIYHEMLTHVAMLTHPRAKRVLIIGAGDGGILREVLRYDVERVVMVEIDEKVIELSKRYLPTICRDAFSDPRADVLIDDGAKYVAQTKEKFDVVIVDSPDPIGPARILFSKKFYKDILNCMTPKGIIIRQSGSPLLQAQEFKDNYEVLKKVFPRLFVYLAAVPTYIGGFFSFMLASNYYNPTKVSRQGLNKRYKKLNLKTKYYNPDIHYAAFALPNFIKAYITRGGRR